MAGSLPFCTGVGGLTAPSVVATTKEVAALGTIELEDAVTTVVPGVETVGSDSGSCEALILLSPDDS